jgi:hypothetical protein
VANACDLGAFYLTAHAIVPASNWIGQIAVSTITPKTTSSDPLTGLYAVRVSITEETSDLQPHRVCIFHVYWRQHRHR